MTSPILKLLQPAGEAPKETGRRRTLTEMRANPATPPLEVAPRLAWAERVSMLAGAPKESGKSTLLMHGAGIVTRAGGSVLWVSADQEHEGDIRTRADRFGVDGDRLTVRWPSAPGAPALDELRSDVAELAPTWVIIDTFPNWAAIEDLAKPEAGAVIIELRRLAVGGPALTISTHTPRSDPKRYADSRALGANVDMILTCFWKEEEPKHWRRFRSMGRWDVTPELILALEGNDYRVVTATEAETQTPRGKDRLELHQALGDGEHTARDIALALDKHKTTVEKRLKKDPAVERRAEGQTYLYRLTPPAGHHSTTAPSIRRAVVAVVDAEPQQPPTTTESAVAAVGGSDQGGDTCPY